MPALFTSTSSRPKSRSVPSIAAMQFAAGNRSAQINPQDAPDFRRSVCKCFPASPYLSTKTGMAPSRAQPRAMAAPMPLAPPVITTTLSLSCKSMLRRFQSVKTSGVAAKNPFPVGQRVSLHVVLEDLFPLTIRCGQQTYWPIGAKHQAVRTESIEDHVEVRLEIIRLPLLPIRLRDEAGHLAEPILVLRDVSHLRAPGFGL